MRTAYVGGTIAALLMSASGALAESGEQYTTKPEEGQKTRPEQDEIVVRSARSRALASGMLANTVEQTEVVDLQDLTNMQANVLSDALSQTPGARVNNECSMCGVKRLMLNGLGGQHTTMLIDGMPAHTMVSGFYGPDALGMAGVERVEVARGAGASLTAPEAIGGTVNIITEDPSRTGAKFNAAIGENEYRRADLVGTFANAAGSLRALAAFQYDHNGQYDGDHNGVSESPFVQNYNYMARVSVDPTPNSTLTVRGAYVDSEIFGGPVLGDNASSIADVLAGYDGVPSAQLFEGGNVNNRFIGKPWETSEWIATKRHELMARYFQEFSASLNLDAGVSWSSHKQDSFYEGFDYRADNDMLYAMARLNWSPLPNHLFTFGADTRTEELRSHSNIADNNPAYVSDSFNYDTMALFVQDTWTPTPQIDVNIAARLDHVKADFIDPARPGVEIDQTLFSPRVDVRFHHTDRITSRVSAGRGYRAPLSFFESDHGILDAGLGFEVDVHQLERSLSATYALSFEGDRLTWTAGAAWTRIDNLAALDETASGVPLLTQRTDPGEVYGFTLDVGYQLTDTLTLDFAAETFHQDDVVRSIFGVAPVEQRVIVGATWSPGRWTARASYTLAGARDLSEYGYEGYDDAALTIRKPLHGDAHGDLDARAEYAFTDRISGYVGVRNLLNHTQVEDETSPLFFDASGGYDVAYIYGDLRGREAYVGIRGQF